LKQSSQQSPRVHIIFSPSLQMAQKPSHKPSQYITTSLSLHPCNQKIECSSIKPKAPVFIHPKVLGMASQSKIHAIILPFTAVLASSCSWYWKLGYLGCLMQEGASLGSASS